LRCIAGQIYATCLHFHIGQMTARHVRRGLTPGDLSGTPLHNLERGNDFTELLQPDLQFIINTGAVHGSKNALVAGPRFRRYSPVEDVHPLPRHALDPALQRSAFRQSYLATSITRRSSFKHPASLLPKRYPATVPALFFVLDVFHSLIIESGAADGRI